MRWILPQRRWDPLRESSNTKGVNCVQSSELMGISDYKYTCLHLANEWAWHLHIQWCPTNPNMGKMLKLTWCRHQTYSVHAPTSWWCQSARHNRFSFMGSQPMLLVGPGLQRNSQCGLLTRTRHPVQIGVYSLHNWMSGCLWVTFEC